MHHCWACLQGHEAILQKFHQVNLVISDGPVSHCLLEVAVLAQRSKTVDWAAKALQAATDPWETQ